MSQPSYGWYNLERLAKTRYTCGFCSSTTAPDKGYITNAGLKGRIYICPNCTNPTFLDVHGSQHPGIRMGNDVKGITDDGVQHLYNEARDCTKVGAHTAATLLCRKLLMNIAVQHGAKEGKSFVSYINYLESAGYVPPNGKEWVDHIRKKGNEATHEIALIPQEESRLLLHFVEMLLRFIYEFPSMLPQS